VVIIDYKELLRDWLTKNVFSQHYNWLVAGRRFVGTGFHMPALVDYHDGAPSILLCCDVSGSMLNPKDLPMVAAEIQGVLEEFPGKYFVIYTDTEFKGIQEISYEEPLVLKFETGGGGTDFRKIMEYVKDSDLDFEALLVFTDMETNNFGADPGKPVLWMNTDRDNRRIPSFGKIINIDQPR
jgi:predicted metal-dependent peptidase